VNENNYLCLGFNRDFTEASGLAKAKGSRPDIRRRGQVFLRRQSRNIDQAFPLAEAAEAHRLLQNRKSIGKIILKTKA
jgi:NADPH:quinone reductase-like Zn-dependent oxidoreductase